jgi:hypothetical protein
LPASETTLANGAAHYPTLFNGKRWAIMTSTPRPLMSEQRTYHWSEADDGSGPISLTKSPSRRTYPRSGRVGAERRRSGPTRGMGFCF